jgi:hypothetical protein
VAHLTSKERKKLPSKDFGEPKKRGFPMEDKAHAKDAKSRASAMVNKGKMSKATEGKIDRKADAKLGKKKGK